MKIQITLCPEGSLNAFFDFLQGAQTSWGSQPARFLPAFFFFNLGVWAFLGVGWWCWSLHGWVRSLQLSAISSPRGCWLRRLPTPRTEWFPMIQPGLGTYIMREKNLSLPARTCSSAQSLKKSVSSSLAPSASPRCCQHLGSTWTGRRETGRAQQTAGSGTEQPGDKTKNCVHCPWQKIECRIARGIEK